MGQRTAGSNEPVHAPALRMSCRALMRLYGMGELT